VAASRSQVRDGERRQHPWVVQVTTPRTYAIEVEFDPNMLEGTPVPVMSANTYTFTTSLGASGRSRLRRSEPPRPLS
jgi:hypothetical protein